MWRWQLVTIHKVIFHKRYMLWAKLCAVSCVAHALFLFFLFFLYRTRGTDISLVISKNMLNRNVSVLLAQIQVPRAIKKQPQRTISRTVKKTMQPKEKNVQKKNVVPKKVVKKAVPPKVPKTAVVAEKKKDTPIKKTEPVQKTIEQKKVEPKKQLQKKIPPNKTAQKIVQKKVQSKKTVIPTKQQVQNNVQDLDASIAINVEQQYDTEALLRYAALQKEFMRCWKPPIGVPKNCSCAIKLFVNAVGKVQNMQMIRSSGILMYDVAARSALSVMTLPRWTRNKALTITFK